jgi:hypothetical protein
MVCIMCLDIGARSVADPDPGSGIWDPVPFLTPGSGMGKKSRYRYGSGMNILDHISESVETIFWVRNT